MTYRCVICWRAKPWDEGCADDADIGISAAVDQRVFSGRTRPRIGRMFLPRRRRLLKLITNRPRITDGGLCDDCWCVMGGEAITVEVAA